MQYPFGLGGLQPGNHVYDRVDGLAYRKRPVTLDPLLKSTSFDQLHHNRRGALDFSGAVNIDAVLVIDRSSQPAFAEKARPCLGGIQAIRQYLQGNPAARLELLRFLNRSHAAAAQLPYDPVFAKLVSGIRQVPLLRRFDRFEGQGRIL
jgi:hypothetical protein